ncbi:MAG: nucleotidyl transferase AbiEii/AbiGii toxin family protein [Actinomycetes bacterium]
MTAPTRATPAGQAYLDLRTKARGDRRPVDELLQLYVLESFLARLAESRFADQLVLKGGVLLAAFGERRPTRDIDLQAQALDNDAENVRAVICEVAARRLDDGVVFDVDGATATVIRDEDAYSGVRVTMRAELATARPHFHVDVNVGDPITPAPKELRLPRLLGGEVAVRGYPLVMVHAEKIVTGIARGTANTRWRDFADIYLLSRRHSLAGADLAGSVRQVARHRQVELVPLARVLDGYGGIGQGRWAAWRRKQQLEDRLPDRFAEVIAAVAMFADPVIAGTAADLAWDPASGAWSSVTDRG